MGFTNTSQKSSSSAPSKKKSASSKEKSRSASSSRPSSSSSPSSAPALSQAQQQLAALVLQPEVRVALSQALSEPVVAETIQATLGAALTEGKAGARKCFLEKLPNLIPIATSLVAARPELISVVAQLFAILREEGVVCGGGGGCSAFFPLVASLLSGQSCGSVCKRQTFDGCPSGGAPGRASRDNDWRAHLGVGIKALSAKLSEAAAVTSAAASTAVDAAAESVGISSPVTSHGRKKIEQSQVAAAIEASKRDKEELDLRKAVNASLETIAAASIAKSSASKDPSLSPADDQAALRNHQNKNYNKTESKASDYGGESKTADIEKPRARFVKDVAPRRSALSPGQPFTHS